MSRLIEHFKKGTFEEEYWIPAHNERRESALFSKHKKFLRESCGVTCWVCGCQEGLEIHHVFEWAFWNALDPKKVTNILNAIEFYDNDYVGQAKNPTELRQALEGLKESKPVLDSPDDLRNLVALCTQHHRLKFTGIHTVSFPLWLAIAGVPSKGGLLSREQLAVAVERVSRIDEELATYVGNNYTPHRT